MNVIAAYLAPICAETAAYTFHSIGRVREMARSFKRKHEQKRQKLKQTIAAALILGPCFYVPL